MTRNSASIDIHEHNSSKSNTGMSTRQTEDRQNEEPSNNQGSMPLQQPLSSIYSQPPQLPKYEDLPMKTNDPSCEKLLEEYESKYNANELTRPNMAEKARGNPVPAPLTADNLSINAAEHCAKVLYTPICDRCIKDQICRTKLAWQDPRMQEKMALNFTSGGDTSSRNESTSLADVFLRHENARLLQMRPAEPQTEDDLGSALATDGLSDTTVKAQVLPSSSRVPRVPNQTKWAQIYPSEYLSGW